MSLSVCLKIKILKWLSCKVKLLGTGNSYIFFSGGFPLPPRTLKGSFYSAYKNDATQYKWLMFTIRPVYILFDQWWASNVWRPFYRHYNKLPLEEAVSVDKVIYRFELNLKMKIDINFKFEAPCWCWFAVQMERDLLKLIHSK